MKTKILYKFLLICGLCVSMGTARAQWAPVSYELAQALYRVDSGCADIGVYEIDTTCPALLSVKSVTLSNDATGLQYFKGLDTLVCQYLVNIQAYPPSLKYLFYDSYDRTVTTTPFPDSLRTLIFNYPVGNLPSLPPYLEYLGCLGGNQTDSLPALPQTLTTLVCDNNIQLNMVSSLPSGLKKLIFTYNTRLNSVPPLPPLPSSLTYLDCRSARAPSLASLPPAMDTLICSDNNFTSLPTLPSTLRYLNCNVNSLQTLPSLPGSLIRLECSGDSLLILPALPSGLNYLDCSTNVLSVLPALPSGIIYLNCSVNRLSALPALPTAATYINCWANRIPSLPSLPAGLTFLDFGSNLIRTMPTLPASLRQLSCANNPLYTVGVLPDSITTLNCADDSLSMAPSLPPALQILNISGNQIRHLLPIPSTLTELNCYSNVLLADLPRLPDSLHYLDISDDSSLSCLPPCGFFSNFFLETNGTNIRCLPNHINGLGNTVINQLLPLCTPASGCPFFYNIQGVVHEDTSATCALDSASPGAALHYIKVMLKQNGQVLQQIYTSDYGDYSFKTDSLTGYEVAVDSSQLPLVPACPVGGVRSVQLTTTDSIAFGQNLGLMCSSNDAAVWSTGAGRFRPAFSSFIYPNITNPARIYGATCGAAISGTVTVTISGPVSYTGPVAGALTPSSVSGLTLTYTVADLGASTYLSFGTELMTDSTAALGSDVCITTTVTPTVPDANPADDTLTNCYTVVNSLDPNLKEVYPKTLTQNADWLTYTIHFQNTGSDTAYTVVVRDTLSNSVQPETFQYLASSHKVVVQLMGSAMVFTFPKINLVDSATNPPLSEGWIQYKVKAKANLPLQTQVKNTAYIYFDLNPAVVTNTTVNIVDTVAAPNGITHIADAKPIYLYPNPNAGTFTLQTTAMHGGEYMITDMLGHVVEQKTITADRQAVYMGAAASGVYTLSLKGAQPVRFVVVR